MGDSQDDGTTSVRDRRHVSVREKFNNIISNVTVEPILLCYILPNYIANLATMNMNLEKACRVNLNYSSDLCDEIARRWFSFFFRQGSWTELFWISEYLTIPVWNVIRNQRCFDNEQYFHILVRWFYYDYFGVCVDQKCQETRHMAVSTSLNQNHQEILRSKKSVILKRKPVMLVKHTKLSNNFFLHKILLFLERYVK